MAAYAVKSIYFPAERTRANRSARVTITLPDPNAGDSAELALMRHLRSLSSRDFRMALGDPVLEDLESIAATKGLSLSAVCITTLRHHFEPWLHIRNGSTSPSTGEGNQLALSIDMIPSSAGVDQFPYRDAGLTFRDSRRQAVHGWYPYVEGFAATYVRDAILRSGRPARAIYDPFGGAGTTQLTAATLGVPSYYCEVNPFMQFVSNTKVGAAAWARSNLREFRTIADRYRQALVSPQITEIADAFDLSDYNHAFPGRDYFQEADLRLLLAARNLALQVAGPSGPASDILLLACASNTVRSSNMTRRADLRRRRSDEYKTRIVNVPESIVETLDRMVIDIEQLPPTMAPSSLVANDARCLPSEYTAAFDLAITSPPYLNGTNYFRNTKLELWLLGYIKTESELSSLHASGIACGINSVTRTRVPDQVFPEVERYAEQLDICTGDWRIPQLVRLYFTDMASVLGEVYRSLRHSGRFILDIGDSKFYGVHVPTDRLIVSLAERMGFECVSVTTLARRYSRDKSELAQVEIVLQKSAARRPVHHLNVSTDGVREGIRRFGERLPYKEPPYSSREWGHPLHSLCSYQGKLKPSMAYWLVREFVPRHGSVLDPLGGVGTIAFEAALAGHNAVSNDMSPLASVIAKGKLDPPSISAALDVLQSLDSTMRAIDLSPEDYKDAEFGLNATVADYYHSDTLGEILRMRRIFLQQDSHTSTDAFVWAALLHVLHGNRPYALSRTSHPITPFHPSGEAVYKSVVGKVRDRIVRALRAPLPPAFCPARSTNADFRDLPTILDQRFSTIITSPPFIGMRFDRPNWLRMWFCGWTESDFHKQSLRFLERQQMQSRDCYFDFYSTCRQLIEPNGLMVVHVGSGGRLNLVEDLKRIAISGFKLVGEIRENVTAIEQHGIRDKGLTSAHHLLFLQPA